MSQDQQTAAECSTKSKRNPYNHADRVPTVPERSSCYCAAHGCPMLGTMSTHTTGASEWWCYLHFGRDAGRLQSITVEVNRREWLSKAITDLRTNYGRDTWPDVCRSVRHEFAMQQRTDLRDTAGESGWAWIVRLEHQLKSMVSSTPVSAPKQRSIEQADTWAKVGFEAPVAA